MLLDPSSVNQWFQSQLSLRGTCIESIEDISEFVPSRNFWIKLKLMHTTNNEAYLVSFWRDVKDKIKSQDQVSIEGKELDERMRYARKNFSPQIDAMVMMKEPTLLRLLEYVTKGTPVFIVAIYPDCSTYWISVQDFYEFATRYGTYQNFSRFESGMSWLPYRVPTGWFKPWANPISRVASIFSGE